MGVCGDSWMSPPLDYPWIGTHFSEILAKQNNLVLRTYARQGSSNGAICLQIEQAIKDKCDIILFGTSTYNRIEFTLENYLEDNMNNFGHHFDQDIDITYFDVAEPSKEIRDRINSNTHTYKLAHSTIINILNDKTNFNRIVSSFGKIKDKSELDKKFQAIKLWFNHMYNPIWKQKIDRYCLYSVLHKLVTSKIPYVFVFDFIKIPDAFWLDHPLYGEPFTNKSYIGPINKDPGYHTTPEEQHIILDKVKSKLFNKGIKLVD